MKKTILSIMALCLCAVMSFAEEVVISYSQLPYSEGFESVGNTVSTAALNNTATFVNYYQKATMPNGWGSYNKGGGSVATATTTYYNRPYWPYVVTNGYTTNATTTNYGTSGSANTTYKYAASGVNSLKLQGYNPSSSSASYQAYIGPAWAVMPKFDTDVNMQKLVVTGKAKIANTNTFIISVGVMTDPADISTFVEMGTFGPGKGLTNTCDPIEFEVPLKNYTGTGHYIAFRTPLAPSTVTAIAYLDDIYVYEYTCDAPVPSVAGITYNNAQIAIDIADVKYDLKVMEGAVAAKDVETTQGSLYAGVEQRPYSINNLQADQQYTVAARVYCDATGSTKSVWKVVSFKTLCQYATKGTDNVYYKTGFEDSEGFVSGSALATKVLPCWEVGNASSGATYLYMPYVTGQDGSSQGGDKNNHYLYIYSTADKADAYAVLPPITPKDGDWSKVEMSFKMTCSTTSSYNHKVKIGIMNNPLDPTTFKQIAEKEINVPTTDIKDGWQDVVVTFENYDVNKGFTGNCIAFYTGYTNATSYAYIDDVDVHQIPTMQVALSVTALDTVYSGGEYSTNITYTDPTAADSVQITKDGVKLTTETTALSSYSFGMVPDTAVYTFRFFKKGYMDTTITCNVQIRPRAITMTSASDSKQFDGDPLTNATITFSGDGFVGQDTVSCTVTGSQTAVGTSPNYFTYTFSGSSEDNYSFTKVEGTLEVTEAPVTDYVCKIGTKGYASIAEAVAAVQAGETIQVLKDIQLDAMISVASTTPAFTLDLNGHILDGSNLTGNNASLIRNEGTLSIIDSDPTATHEAPFDTIAGAIMTGGKGYYSGSYYCGGAIYNKNSTLTVDGVAFVNNSAYYGGAVCSFNSTSTITNCRFYGNSSTTGYGSAIYLNDNSQCSVDSCVIKGNSTKIGTVYAYTASLTIAHTTITDNAGTLQGGGMFMQAVNLTLGDGLVVTNNTSGADYQSAGVYIWTESGSINTVTMSGKVIIKDNTTNGKAANLCLSGMPTCDSITLNGLSEGSEVYVSTLLNDEVAPATFATNATEADLQYLKSDNGYAFVLDKNGKIVSKQAYGRKVTNGNFGTICLDKQFVAMEGVDGLFVPYEKTETTLFCEEVELKDIVAGGAYIFKSNADSVTFALEGEAVTEPANNDHMRGWLAADFVLTGETDSYMLNNNQIIKPEIGSTILKNRAFIDLADVPNKAAAPARGRKISFGIDGTNTTTGLMQNAECTMQSGKMMVNGQLIIIREGRKFNAQGQEL